jgi:hypothetical protein
MKSFEIFLSLLATIPAPRRAEGKLYRLPHILLFSILAVSSGANSYRGIRTFIRVHRKRLNQAFGIDWKRAPAHTSIRFILQGLKAAHVETAFRDHAGALDDAATIAGVRALALDGKVLKGSFDAFNDAKARQVLSAFATDTALVLAHFEIVREIQRNPGGAKAFRGTRSFEPRRDAGRHALPKKTFEAGAAANAHLIVQLKENQPTLCALVAAHCCKAPLLSCAQTIDDKCRNRHETRSVGVFDAAPAVPDTEWETHVAAIVAVERMVHAFQPATGLFKTSNEISFYLSNRPIGAEQAADAVRGHWGIESAPQAHTRRRFATELTDCVKAA